MPTLIPNITIPNVYTQRINLFKGFPAPQRINIYVNSVTGSDGSKGSQSFPYRTIERALHDAFELLSTRQIFQINIAGASPHILPANLIFPQVGSPDEITVDPAQPFWDTQAPFIIQGIPALLYTISAAQVLSQVADPSSGLIVLTTTYLLAPNVLQGKYIVDALGNIASIASNAGQTINLCDSMPMVAPLKVYDSSVNTIAPAVPGALTPTVNLRGSTAPIIFQGVKITGTAGGAIGLGQGVSALLVGSDVDSVVLAMASHELSNEVSIRFSGCKIGKLSGHSGAIKMENSLQTGIVSYLTPMTRLEANDSVFESSSPVGYGVDSEMSVNSLVMKNCEVLNATAHGVRMVHGVVHLTNLKISNSVDAGFQLEQNASGFARTIGGSGNGAGIVALTGASLAVSSDTTINAGGVNELVVGVNPAIQWTTLFGGAAPHSSRDSAQGASVYQEGESPTSAGAPRGAGTEVTGDYTVIPSDQAIYAITAGVPSTISLPPLDLNRGRTFTIKKMDAAVDAVIIAAFAGDLIDGALTYSLLNQFNSVTFTGPPSGNDWAVTVEFGGGSSSNTINVESFGALVGTRPTINFIGATVVDNGGFNRVDVTVTAGLPTGNYNCPIAVTVFDFVYISGSDLVDRANASAVGTAPAIGLVLSKPTPITAEVMFGAAEISGFAGLTPGAAYYLTTSDGAISITPPSAIGNVVQRIGRAKNATTLLVQISEEFVVL